MNEQQIKAEITAVITAHKPTWALKQVEFQTETVFHSVKDVVLEDTETLSRVCEKMINIPKFPISGASISQEIKKAYKYSKKDYSGGSGFQTTFEWLQTIPPESAKYYGHKLINQSEYNTILRRLKSVGIPDFESIENCTGYQKFQAMLQNINSGKTEMKNVSEILRYKEGNIKIDENYRRDVLNKLKKVNRSEYDDSGPIDPKAVEAGY